MSTALTTLNSLKLNVSNTSCPYGQIGLQTTFTFTMEMGCVRTGLVAVANSVAVTRVLCVYVRVGGGGGGGGGGGCRHGCLRVCLCVAPKQSCTVAWCS